jgi:hypothetical protein
MKFVQFRRRVLVHGATPNNTLRNFFWDRFSRKEKNTETIPINCIPEQAKEQQQKTSFASCKKNESMQNADYFASLRETAESE